MPEKQKNRSWKEIQTMIAAIAMMMLFGVCNVIASFERREAGEDVDSGAALTATPNPAPTMVREDSKLAPVSPEVITSTGSS